MSKNFAILILALDKLSLPFRIYLAFLICCVTVISNAQISSCFMGFSIYNIFKVFPLNAHDPD